MQNYEIIIIGGGPVGIALGMHDIKTLIIEKYN